MATGIDDARAGAADRGELLAGVDRAAFRLSLAALPFLVFMIGGPTQYRLVQLSATAAIVLAVLAVVGAVAARLRQRAVVAAAGAAFMLAALLQLAQVGRGTNWLGGNGSTFALFLAFGAGLLVLGTVPWWIPRTTPDDDGSRR